MTKVLGFRGEILSVPRDPLLHPDNVVRHEPDGILIIEDGIIVARGAYEDLAPRFPGVTIHTLPGLIVPGFVDSHVHYPQIDRIASHGEQLLDWLQRHIFPAEAAFEERTHADEVASFFTRELLRNGTTTALVFGTVHPASVDALFEQALSLNMRLISGKVLMDQGPENLRDTAKSGHQQTEELIRRWHRRGRLGYAITPRFALTSSNIQLESAGSLLAEYPDVLLHTHLSENLIEIDQVAQRFPTAMDYLDVYDRFGLVTNRSVFAHCIHMDERSLRRMNEAGAGIAFCPTSNLFLGSGLFDLVKADQHGIKIGIGTDIGAGTSLSILHTLGEAYKICQLKGHALNPFRALYLATAGGARLLNLEDRIGALEVGQEADFVLLDTEATPLMARRTRKAGLFERLFCLQVLGDDRAVRATFLAGRMVHHRDQHALSDALG